MGFTTSHVPIVPPITKNPMSAKSRITPNAINFRVLIVSINAAILININNIQNVYIKDKTVGYGALAGVQNGRTNIYHETKFLESARRFFFLMLIEWPAKLALYDERPIEDRVNAKRIFFQA